MAGSGGPEGVKHRTGHGEVDVRQSGQSAPAVPSEAAAVTQSGIDNLRAATCSSSARLSVERTRYAVNDKPGVERQRTGCFQPLTHWHSCSTTSVEVARPLTTSTSFITGAPASA